MNRSDAPKVAGVLLLLFAAWACGVPVQARAPQITSLDGEWQLLADPGNVGLLGGPRADWSAWLGTGEVPRGLEPPPGPVHRVQVPGPLEQVPELIAYDGVVWIWRDIELPPRDAAHGRRLRFEQVNHSVRVWCGMWELGEHEGGYGPFELSLDGVPAGTHRLVLRVVDPGAAEIDGLTLATTPHAKESWYHNFGGVLGSVSLVTVRGAAPRIRRLHADATSGEIALSFLIDGPGRSEWSERECELIVERLGDCDPRVPPEDWPASEVVARRTVEAKVFSNAKLRVDAEVIVPAPELWSPESPQLYRLRLRTGEAEDARVFGFREVRLDAEGFALNGVPRRLLGVLDQPHDTGLGGLAPSREVLAAKAMAMKALGFNMVRAHVRPAWPAFLDACDALGLLVLEEPAIGWVDDSEELHRRLSRELRWMVMRDAHHPSIVIWGVLNELSGEAYRYAEELVRELGELDPSRPVLEDSGGFFGARYLPAAAAGEEPGARALLPMLDEHVYPPYPVPPGESERMRTLVASEGPSFVSEFGYGTLIDAESALRGFTEREIHSEESLFFAAAAKVQRAAARRNDGWASERRFADGRRRGLRAASDMLVRLRANPALQMITLTQWQGVSTEPSAGVISPWGGPISHGEFDDLMSALQPRRLQLLPRRASLRPGEEKRVDIAVINDTLEPWVGALFANGERLAEERSYPPGVTLLRDLVEPPTELPGGMSELGLGGLDAIFHETVSVDEPPTGRELLRGEERLAVRAWLPESLSGASEFASRQGFAPAQLPRAGEPCVALLGDPAGARERLGLRAWLRVLKWVHAGGSAVFLLEPPESDALARLVGGGRGMREVADLPVPLQTARAAGNFLGRWHVIVERDGMWAGDALSWSRPAVEGSFGKVPPLEYGAWRWTGDADPSEGADLGGRGVAHVCEPEPLVLGAGGLDDGALSPHSMIVGDPRDGVRTAMQTLGHFGNRLGDPIHSVPYGAGQFVFVGLPLLEPIDGQPDPRRERLLARLLMLAADEQAERDLFPAAGEPLELDDRELAQLETALDAVDRVAALSGRFSSQAKAPRRASESVAVPIGRALEHQRAAYDALARGKLGVAAQRMLSAYSLVWDDEMAAFLALEAHVLDGLMKAAAAGTRAGSDAAFRAYGFWVVGIKERFVGHDAVSLDWMGRAQLLLRDAGWLDEIH